MFFFRKSVFPSYRWLGYLTQGWSISRKINSGYALSIGIAILGTSVGLVIGNYHQEQAQEQQAIANQQQRLLSELENTLGIVRSHPQRLVSVLGESVWFDYEKTKFLGAIAQVKELLAEFESFTTAHADDLAIDTQASQNLLTGYALNIKSYNVLTETLWQQLKPADLKPAEIPAAQQQFVASLREQPSIRVNVELDRLAESLARLKETAQAQYTEANVRLEQAEVLRMQIIFASMLLSAIIASILALLTSQAIAHPLKALTQVAKAVVHESNFELRSAIATQDEVGSLATSLNQLVQWVGEYTQALELARQTLEQRVEERTQDLTAALYELQQTQAQLIQTEKMSSLGQLVAGVAHEINNPINFIHGNLKYTDNYTQNLLELIHLYQQQYPPTTVIQNYIEEIDLDFIREDVPKLVGSMNKGAERIRQIVLSLRNFSRLDEAEIKPVDIHEGIENTLLILNQRLKPNISVSKEYGDLPLVECYPAQLNQVFMNILANAIDALEEVAHTGTDFSPQLRICTDKVAENTIRVSILDNGSGISPDIQAKLFDPFFTTKPIGKGTGLGLSICYQIVEKHQGKIEVISTDWGTEFAIFLPITASIYAVV